MVCPDSASGRPISWPSERSAGRRRTPGAGRCGGPDGAGGEVGTDLSPSEAPAPPGKDGPPGSASHSPRRFRALTAEVVGTAMLVAIATGPAVAAAKIGGVSQWELAAAAFVAISLLVVLFVSVSGAHINPAITLALWAMGRFPRERVLPYVGAQVLGAFAGSAIVLASVGSALHLGATVPAGGDWPRAMVDEFGFSFLLALSVALLVVVGPGRARLGLLAPGAVVAAATYVIGPWTGCSLNPARSLAPAALSGPLPSPAGLSRSPGGRARRSGRQGRGALTPDRREPRRSLRAARAPVADSSDLSVGARGKFRVVSWNGGCPRRRWITEPSRRRARRGPLRVHHRPSGPTTRPPGLGLLPRRGAPDHPPRHPPPLGRVGRPSRGRAGGALPLRHVRSRRRPRVLRGHRAPRRLVRRARPPTGRPAADAVRRVRAPFDDRRQRRPRLGRGARTHRPRSTDAAFAPAVPALARLRGDRRKRRHADREPPEPPRRRVQRPPFPVRRVPALPPAPDPRGPSVGRTVPSMGPPPWRSRSRRTVPVRPRQSPAAVPPRGLVRSAAKVPGPLAVPGGPRRDGDGRRDVGRGRRPGRPDLRAPPRRGPAAPGDLAEPAPGPRRGELDDPAALRGPVPGGGSGRGGRGDRVPRLHPPAARSVHGTGGAPGHHGHQPPGAAGVQQRALGGPSDPAVPERRVWGQHSRGVDGARRREHPRREPDDPRSGEQHHPDRPGRTPRGTHLARGVRSARGPPHGPLGGAGARLPRDRAVTVAPGSGPCHDGGGDPAYRPLERARRNAQAPPAAAATTIAPIAATSTRLIEGAAAAAGAGSTDAL